MRKALAPAGAMLGSDLGGARLHFENEVAVPSGPEGTLGVFKPGERPP
jgi:hypothetical protein